MSKNTYSNIQNMYSRIFLDVYVIEKTVTSMLLILSQLYLIIIFILVFFSDKYKTS